MSETSNCIFCRIAAGQIPSSKVLETEKIFIFNDINPKAPVHALAIPKEHITEISELSKVSGELFEAISSAAKKLRVNESGYRIVVNNGKDAGQEVSHIHFHILGGRHLDWPPG